MKKVSIISRSLGGLMVDIDINNDGQPVNAYFASSGNELPYKMWMILTNSIYDMMQAQEEINAYA